MNTLKKNLFSSENCGTLLACICRDFLCCLWSPEAGDIPGNDVFLILVKRQNLGGDGVFSSDVYRKAVAWLSAFSRH